MPISREEFDAERVDISIPIVQLLEANADLAYTTLEVQQRLLERFGRVASPGEVGAALINLFEAGLVERKEIGLQLRYAIVVVAERESGES